MPRWKILSYKDREIKTRADEIWMAEELIKLGNSGKEFDMSDIMALSHIKEIWREVPEEQKKQIGKMIEDNKIKNRWEILDL